MLQVYVVCGRASVQQYNKCPQSHTLHLPEHLGITTSLPINTAYFSSSIRAPNQLISIPQTQTLPCCPALSLSRGSHMLPKPALCHLGCIRPRDNKIWISKAYRKIKFTWCTEVAGMLESTVPAQWKWQKFVAFCPKSLGMKPAKQPVWIRITLYFQWYKMALGNSTSYVESEALC